MTKHIQDQPILATYPISEDEVVVLFSTNIHVSMVNEAGLYTFESGLKVHEVRLDETSAQRLVLRVDRMETQPLKIDSITINNLITAEGKNFKTITSPSFIHGLPTAMELKVPHLESNFPYATKFQNIHVSVACCTGCNGGVHHRNLVVLNHHLGGGWSGIWVKTGKTIEAPYPRWQKVLCAGGVISEESGSMTVLDKGWMEIHKLNEVPHHAPPPLPIETIDLPCKQNTSLMSKSLDGAWVQFDDITVHSAKFVEAKETCHETVNLPRTEIIFSDKSGGKTEAWLFQPSGHKVIAGQKLSCLRGFVHAEQPGVYVMLSDKEEDIIANSQKCYCSLFPYEKSKAWSLLRHFCEFFRCSKKKPEL